MSANTLQQLHGDHQAWQSENAFWRDQIREWQRETGHALGQLAEIADVLRDHERKLETHAAAIRLYDQACRQHEHELAHSPTAQTACSGHCAEAYDHLREREKHETLKRRHHTLLAQWTALLRTFREI